MTISYESLLPEVLPMVVGCTDTLVENSIRSSVIEFCERTSAYQQELDPLTTILNVYEYDLEPPTGTTVHKVLWVTHDGEDLEPTTTTLLEQRVPRWRSDNGTPAYFVQQSSSLIWLVPTPSSKLANSTIIRAVLKPTHTSSSCDDGVMNDYRDTIVNGALNRLLRIPNKDWTDLNGAQYYGALFNQGVEDAERRARNADTGVRRRVRYGGIGRSRLRNQYGRERG
jgi:hypothetical protein|tara:strand:- start:12874 stop:13551 length:678 start_codon:yes stop_codon:yes gene_type:complete